MSAVAGSLTSQHKAAEYNSIRPGSESKYDDFSSSLLQFGWKPISQARATSKSIVFAPAVSDLPDAGDAGALGSYRAEKPAGQDPNVTSQNQTAVAHRPTRQSDTQIRASKAVSNKRVDTTDPTLLATVASNGVDAVQPKVLSRSTAQEMGGKDGVGPTKMSSHDNPTLGRALHHRPGPESEPRTGSEQRNGESVAPVISSPSSAGPVQKSELPPASFSAGVTLPVDGLRSSEQPSGRPLLTSTGAVQGAVYTTDVHQADQTELTQSVSAGASKPGDLSIRLSLPNLGIVEVRIGKNEGPQPTMTISAERSDTLQAIMTDEAQLRSILHDSGIEQGRSDIEYAIIPPRDPGEPPSFSSSDEQSHQPDSRDNDRLEVSDQNLAATLRGMPLAATSPQARHLLGAIDITA